MSRKVLIPILILVVAAAAAIGALAARAQGSATLPAITPSQLLVNVATKAHETKSLSGDVAWSNGLLGDTSALNLGGAAAPTGIASLLQGGEGRIWLQDGKVRLESQGQGGDLVVTAADGSLWTYSSITNVATQYSVPTGAGNAESATPQPSSSTGAPTVSQTSLAVDPTVRIEQLLQKLAPTAELAVTGQESVAGQQSYILTMTGAASSTSFGSLRVAIDGTTFVPLRVEVYAKGASAPALSAGFTSVSYAHIDDALFDFTPPAGAEVEHKTVTPPAGLEAEKGAQESGGDGSAPQGEAKPLTLEQAQAQAGFDLALPSDPALQFNGAAVIPAKQGIDGRGPIAVLHYGEGFGSIVLIETQATADQAGKLQDELTQLAKMQIVQPTIVNGSPGVAFSTALFNAVAWQQGKLMVAAAGMVPQSELSAFAQSVR